MGPDFSALATSARTNYRMLACVKTYDSRVDGGVDARRKRQHIETLYTKGITVGSG
jgi:hypothetical protein